MYLSEILIITSVNAAKAMKEMVSNVQKKVFYFSYSNTSINFIKTTNQGMSLNFELLIYFLLIIYFKDVSCLEANNCGPNASCHPDGSTARCVCNPGYEGNGLTCSPIGYNFFCFY